MSKSTHEIVILGGHFAALGTAHYLLKHVIPKLSTATGKNYHLTIIYPHTEFYWNIAAPRHLVSPTVIPPEKLWMSSDKALKSYTKDSPTTITGTATGVNPDAKTVSVQVADGVQEIGYSTLIVATGTTSNSKLWQVNEHQDVSKALYSEFHAALPKAKTILIAGGGAVGVETAGEVATHYPKASITILSGATSLLPRLSPKPGRKAEAKLKKMGVAVGHNSKVVSNTKNQDGTTTVVLSDGTEKKVDVFIDATGGKPNTSFLPSAWLDPKGYVKVDEKTLRGPAKDVYAIGDVASYSSGSYIDVNNGVPIVGSSIGIDLATEAGKKDLIAQKEFKPFPAQFVPVGPSAGVGEVFGWSIPSFLVWLVKSRTFFVDKAESGWDGSGFAKA